MNLSQFVRYLQGERRGMGSQLAPPTMLQRTRSEFYPSITIPNDVLLSDVSFYQADIEFAKMKAAGLAGVILRAGQRYWIDSKYGVNQAQARAAGLPRGCYFFYDGREDPKKQAALLWSIVKDSDLELWYVMDLEDNYGGAYANKASRRTFIEEFQRLSGLPDDRIIIYTGFYWWNENMGNDVWFKKYRLWLAWYAAESAVRVPAPWTESDLVLWQYTSSGDGLRYGVSSLEIDLDWYNGTPAQFAAEYGGVTEPPTGETMNVSVRNNASSANYRTIREGPAVTFSESGKFYGGSMATGDFIFTHRSTDADLYATAGDKWIQIGVNQWIAQIHAGKVVPDLIVTPLDPPVVSDVIASVITTHEVVITHADGSTDTFRKENLELPKV